MGLTELEGEVVSEETTFLPGTECAHRSGWCMTGDHGGCPLIFGGNTYPDPNRKGARFTTPVYRCPCTCHDRKDIQL